jgi:hypothetical protein
MRKRDQDMEDAGALLEAVRRRAFEIYEERTALGTEGDEVGDWLQAEAEVLHNSE